MTYRTTIMVICTAPQDFSSWSIERKIDRLERVIAWHEYAESLNASGKMPWCWGSYRLVAGFDSISDPEPLTYILDCDSLIDFSNIMETDPLRDVSNYLTIPIRSLDEDAVDDQLKEHNVYESPDEGTFQSIYKSLNDSLFRKKPDYVEEEFATLEPPNPETNFDETAGEDYGVSYLLYGTGPDEYVEWTDYRRDVMERKVDWWHSYTKGLIESGNVTHGWAIQPFCHSAQPASYRKGAIVIMRATDLDDLQRMYEANPLIDEARFVSIALRPIKDQKASDAANLQRLLANNG